VVSIDVEALDLIVVDQWKPARYRGGLIF